MMSELLLAKSRGEGAIANRLIIPAPLMRPLLSEIVI